MKEQDLIDLEFVKKVITTEESDCSNEWYYYTYDITKNLTLISNDSDDAEKNNWYVEFCDPEVDIRFTNIREIAKLIIILENAKI